MIRNDDGDDAQELELNFGKDGTNDADADEGDTLKFIVKRRSTDTGQPGPVHRPGGRPAGAGRTWCWTVGQKTRTPVTTVYKDFPLRTHRDRHPGRAGNRGHPERGGGGRLDLHGRRYSPSRTTKETTWTAPSETLYWTVKSGFRETEIEAADSGASSGTVTLSTTATTVQEGDQVVYTLTRVDGKRAEEITVQVRTWEPNRADSERNNPSQHDPHA